MALYESGRDSLTISIPELNAFQTGLLIALYERAVGYYASLVNINAYHQPGVEAGKRAAAAVLELQHAVRGALRADARTAGELAVELQADPEEVFHILNHLVANDPDAQWEFGPTAAQDRFFLSQAQNA